MGLWQSKNSQWYWSPRSPSAASEMKAPGQQTRHLVSALVGRLRSGCSEFCKAKLPEDDLVLGHSGQATAASLPTCCLRKAGAECREGSGGGVCDSAGACSVRASSSTCENV
jgi:hypothetical protein